MPSSRPGSGPVPEHPGAALRRPHPSPLRRSLVVVVVAACVVATSVPAAAVAEVAQAQYQPPVDAPIVDRFRPPATPYAPGNRGIDYATTPGQPVTASAEGEVTFAGRIGPSGHVVVLHPDGLRTSYSFLETVEVQRGRRVAAGEVVGTAGAVLHFGVRAGERYIDPALLLAGGPVEVHLVPVELREPQAAAQERRWLVDLVGQAVGEAWRDVEQGASAVGQARDDALSWAADAARMAGAEAESLGERALQMGWDALRPELESRWAQLTTLATYGTQLPLSPWFVLHVVNQWERAQHFQDSQADCTASTTPPPPPPPERRIAVLVAGFGSSSDGADVLDVDTAGLGYADQDVAQFSYAGGRTPGTGGLAGVPVTEYGPEHSTADLEEAGKRMGELIDAIAAAHPGVPIDVMAHSQGGVVARLALQGDPPLARLGLQGGPPVANLITLGAPHHGADLATANALLGTTGVGELAQTIAGEVTDDSVDGASKAAAQLSERPAPFDTFRVIPLPAGTRVTSIAARGDLVVAGLQSPLEGATNVMVPIDGISAHSELPGSTLTQRELALALAGLGPTCRDISGDLAMAAGISMGEDILGLAAGAGALWLDRKARVPDGFQRKMRVPGQSGPASAPAGGR